MAKALRCALVGLVCLVGCKPEPLAPIARTRLRVEQDVSNPLPVSRGDSLTLDAWTEFEDGRPAPGAVVDPFFIGQTAVPFQSEAIETGHVRLTIGPFFANAHVDLLSRICPDGNLQDCAGGSVTNLNDIRITVYGGAPGTRLVHGPLDVAVGERRPIRLTAIAMGEPRSPFLYFAERGVTMTSSDSSVLEVNGLIIKGLKAGKVTLTLQGAGVTEQVEVQVSSAPLRTLVNEALPLEGGQVLGASPTMLMERGSTFESVVFDGAKNPVILARVRPPSALADPVDTVLARWTGTGWGAEAPFKDWMNISLPVMVKDERNHVYVGAFDRNRGMFVIAERDLDALGGAFSYHLIPAPAFLAAKTVFPERVALLLGRGGGVDQKTVSKFSDWITLYPRNGGGVHFAVTPSYKVVNCRRVLTVGALTAEGALTHEERETTEWAPNSTGSCDYWTGRVGTSHGEVHWEPPATSTAEPTLGLTRIYKTTPSATWSTRSIDGAPAPGLELVRRIPLYDSYYRFDDGDRTILAGAGGTGFQVIDAYGTYVLDNAGEVLFGMVSGHLLQRSDTWVSGIASLASTLVEVHEGAVGGVPIVTVITLPPALPLDGNEVATDGLAGLRIGRRANPAPVTSLEVLPNGKRVGLAVKFGFESAKASWPGVYRSDAPGARWVPVEDRVSGAFDPEHPLRRQGSKLYTVSFNSTGLITADLHISNDDGETWQAESIFVQANERRPLVAHLFPNGVRLVVSGEPSVSGRTLQLQLRDEGATAWRDLSEWAPPSQSFWTQYQVAAVEASNGGLSVMTSAVDQTTGVNREHLVIREYDAAGQYQRTRDLIVPSAPRLSTATRLPDGDLFFFGGGANQQLPVTSSLRVDALTDVVTRTMLPASPAFFVHSPAVVLGNGAIVVGGERMGTDGPGGVAPFFRSMYMLSTDGVAFGAPVDLRPAGGRAQVVYSLAREPDGQHVVFVIGDSAALWSLRDAAFQFADQTMVSATTPQLAPMSVRVAP